MITDVELDLVARRVVVGMYCLAPQFLPYATLRSRRVFPGFSDRPRGIFPNISPTANPLPAIAAAPLRPSVSSSTLISTISILQRDNLSRRVWTY